MLAGVMVRTSLIFSRLASTVYMVVVTGRTENFKELVSLMPLNYFTFFSLYECCMLIANFIPVIYIFVNITISNNIIMTLTSTFSYLLAIYCGINSQYLEISWMIIKNKMHQSIFNLLNMIYICKTCLVIFYLDSLFWIYFFAHRDESVTDYCVYILPFTFLAVLF